MAEKIEPILRKYKLDPSKIIQILWDVQKELYYLPKESLEFISQRLKVPLSKIYSIATFYSAFSLNPRGKHHALVCEGTACHVRGAAMVRSRLEDRLGIKAGETTDDEMFTLETVNCLGACALAPIVVVDGDYHGQISVQKVDALLDKYQQEETET
jgi:NADH-quinone oxidoreductase subunit E